MLRGAVGVAAAVLSVVARGDTLTLQQAVAAAMDRNPSMRIAAARRNNASAVRTEARSMWLPQIGISETVARSDNPVFVFGSLLEQGRFGAQNFDPAFLNNPDPLTNYRLAMNVRFTVFDQLRRYESNRQASNGIAQAAAGTDEAQQATRLDVISKFYGLLMAQAKRDVAAEAARSAEADAAAIREKYKQGLLVESDALSAEVQLGSFKQQLIEAEGNVRIARAALNAAIGVEVLAETSVAGELPPSLRNEAPLDEQLRRGLAARGEIRATQLGNENAHAQIRIARGSLLPRVDTYANWGASGQTFSDRNDDRTVGAVLSFDILDGSKFARVAQARAAAEEASARETAARDRISMEIISAWERTLSARERVRVAETTVAQATAAARIVHDRYEQGLTTITEQLRAQTAVVAARVSLLSARYDSIVGSAELARSTGGLHDVEPFQ